MSWISKRMALANLVTTTAQLNCSHYNHIGGLLNDVPLKYISYYLVSSLCSLCLPLICVCLVVVVVVFFLSFIIFFLLSIAINTLTNYIMCAWRCNECCWLLHTFWIDFCIWTVQTATASIHVISNCNGYKITTETVSERHNSSFAFGFKCFFFIACAMDSIHFSSLRCDLSKWNEKPNNFSRTDFRCAKILNCISSALLIWNLDIVRVHLFHLFASCVYV